MAMGRTYESVNLQTKVIEGKTASSIKKDNDVNKLKYNAFGSKIRPLIKLQVNKSINKQLDINLRHVTDVVVQGKNVRLMGKPVIFVAGEIIFQKCVKISHRKMKSQHPRKSQATLKLILLISSRQQTINMTMVSMRNQDIPCSISGVRKIIKMIRMW